MELLQNRLPIRVELENIGVLSGIHNLVCPIYHGPKETSMHLFLICPLATQVWKGDTLLVWYSQEGRIRFSGALVKVVYEIYEEKS